MGMTNEETARAWMSGRKPAGKSANGNLNFEGHTLRSYYTPIAVKLENPKTGAIMVLSTNETYSVTTSGKHMPAMRRACNYGDYQCASESILRLLEMLPDAKAAWERVQAEPGIADRIVGGYQAEVDRLVATAGRARLQRSVDGHMEMAKRAQAEMYRLAIAMGWNIEVHDELKVPA